MTLSLQSDEPSSAPILPSAESTPGISNNTNPSVSSDRSTVIITATASIGAALLFGLSFASFYKKRSSRRGNDFSSENGLKQATSFDVVAQEATPQSIMEAREPSPVAISHGHEEDDDKTFRTLEKMYSQDNMSYQSYGYSLEDGIASKHTISPSSTGELSAPVEMNLYALNQQRYNFSNEQTLEVSIESPASTYSGLTDIGTVNNAGKSTKNFNYDEETKSVGTSSASESKKESNFFKRDCIAPPGKLGIIIDTTKDGPSVYQVKSGSPLENVLFEGDLIITIDGISTTGMTASGVTKIMARTMDSERKITVYSSVPV